MKINTFFSPKKTINYKNKLPKQPMQITQNQKSNLSNISYPKSYYLNQISFKRQLRANQVIEKIGEENFPNPNILKKLQEIGESKDFSLYDIHLEHYKALLDCSTLTQAKEIFPEFEDVIDANDIPLENLPKNHILKKIKQNEYKGITIDTLSLQLLKKQYGQILSTKDETSYFDIKTESLNQLFKILNIKKFNRNYYYCISGSNPLRKEIARKKSKEAWEKDDGTRRQQTRDNVKKSINSEEAMAKKLSQEGRNKYSQASQKRWAQDDGTMLQRFKDTTIANSQSEEAIAKRKQTVSSSEYREAKRKTAIEYWQNSEYREKTTKAQQEAFQKPETRKKHSEIMQEKWNDSEYREKQTAIFNSEGTKQRHKEATQNPQYKERMRQLMLLRWSNDDGTMKRQAEEAIEFAHSQQLYESRSLAFKRHPEIVEMMQKVAQNYPKLAEIIKKERSGISLNEAETKIRNGYFKECESAMPNYQKIIGEEQHKILIEWGLIKK